MQHLEKEYGSIDITVKLVTNSYPNIQSLEEFYNFPFNHGWSLGDDYNLEPRVDFEVSRQSDKADLIQSWLFFGLISFVIQDPRTSKPVLEFRELLGLYDQTFINTKALVEALETWKETWKEIWRSTRADSLKLRMVRTELALQLARRVVQKNCTADNIDEFRNQPGYGHYLSPELCLSLMVLGESLSSAKAEVMSLLAVEMRGWQKTDEGGWGPPSYVLQTMKSRRWCPRTIHLLRGELGSNATLLLAALETHNKVDITDVHHRKQCTNGKCNVISGDGGDGINGGLAVRRRSSDGSKSHYRPQHTKTCLQPEKCKMIGPEMEELYRVLEQSQEEPWQTEIFPVLEIMDTGDNNLKLVVHPWDPSIEFSTISHVWSDGLGNEDKNKIYTCQLNFIDSLLEKVARIDGKTNTRRFWMDTLVIPVHREKEGRRENFRELKKLAIRQIYHVFDKSSCSIVIDRGLLDLDADGTPLKVMMKLLASGWMRRVWTLQEAFLSKRLWITFKQDERGHQSMTSFDKITESDVYKTNGTLHSSNTELAKQKLLHNIMGRERQHRIDRRRNGEPDSTDEKKPVASAWRAARWRTTSNPAHETLAFATLLNLDYQETKIVEAGLIDRSDVTDNDLLEKMMSDFWSQMEQDFEGSIPAGIIFLPGEKLSQKGFRWAPRTWMSAHEIDHPNPMNIPTFKTGLSPEGLKVQFPGIVLHCQDRQMIIGTDHNKHKFTFPIDQDLMEWYSVEVADKMRNSYRFDDDTRAKQTTLAIILSRPRPREMPPEIGLLVEISKEKKNGNRPSTYYCNIIHRVRVWREKPLYSRNWNKLAGAGAVERLSTARQFQNVKINDVPELRDHDDPPSILDQPSTRDNEVCIGELVEPDQFWCVDGFGLELSKSEVPRTNPSLLKIPSAVVSSIGLFMTRFSRLRADTAKDSSGLDSEVTVDTVRRPLQREMTLPSRPNLSWEPPRTTRSHTTLS